MTGRPAAFSALAFASTARVADSEMADTRADILVVGMPPWCHLGPGAHQLVSLWASPGYRRSPRAARIGGTARVGPPGRIGRGIQTRYNNALCIVGRARSAHRGYGGSSPRE